VIAKARKDENAKTNSFRRFALSGFRDSLVDELSISLDDAVIKNA